MYSQVWYPGWNYISLPQGPVSGTKERPTYHTSNGVWGRTSDGPLFSGRVGTCLARLGLSDRWPPEMAPECFRLNHTASRKMLADREQDLAVVASQQK